MQEVVCRRQSALPSGRIAGGGGMGGESHVGEGAARRAEVPCWQGPAAVSPPGARGGTGAINGAQTMAVPLTTLAPLAPHGAEGQGARGGSATDREAMLSATSSPDSPRSVSTQTAGPSLGHSGCGLRDRRNKGRDDVEGTGSSGDYAGQQELQAITEDRLWPQPLTRDSPASPALLDSTVHQPAACHREPG
ncbi:unnamed protein product [Arctogadus glacialis]